jgi:hypothetical protein
MRLGLERSARESSDWDAPWRHMAALALSLCLLLAAPAAARAAQKVQLYASFSPDRARVSTTVAFGFTVASTTGGVPSPLEGVDLHLPAGIGLARNTLGTAICEPVYLYAHGPTGCPRNSEVGYGSAVAEVPYGPVTVSETATINAYRGASEEGHLTILFLAEGWTPVFADLVFPGQLLEDSGPFGGRIDTRVPLVPSLPGGPNVSVVRFQSTFGPKNLLYEREVGEELVYYRPRGVTVPAVCPARGYPFAGDFSFEDGSTITVHTSVPCAASARSRRRPGRGARHS